MGDVQLCGYRLYQNHRRIEHPEPGRGRLEGCHERDDPDSYSGHALDCQKPVELTEHGLVVSDCGVQGLFPDEEMKQVVSLVQDLLTFHPLGYTGVQVVGYLLEFDDFSENPGGVLGGL
nr:hypothetical protein [Nocardia africana]